MPSPFPGMDPVIESQEWDDFHSRAIIVISEMVSDALPPGFVARAERRVYLESNPEFGGFRLRTIVPDDAIIEDSRAAGGTMVVNAPVTVPRQAVLAQWDEVEETFLEIRDTAHRRVVTTLELISPSYKRSGRKGRKLYIAKRNEVLQTNSHFVEIDLLRGGRSLCPTSFPPGGDYYAVVSRAERRPAVDLYSWNLADRLPTISIPLQVPHADISLDLQRVLDQVYDRVRYSETIDYSRELAPRPSDAESAWIESLVIAGAT